MKLGFIGTGKITQSVVTGICSSKIKFSKILISPRNQIIAKKLAKNHKKLKSQSLTMRLLIHAIGYF